MSLGYKQEYFPSSVFANVTLDVGGDPTTIAVTTQATSSTTGALIVSGGVGIAKNVYVAGAANITVTTAATSSTTGALVVSGGAGIAGNAHIAGNAVVCGETKTLGFFGASGSTKPNVASGTDAASRLTLLLTALTGLGLVTTS